MDVSFGHKCLDWRCYGTICRCLVTIGVVVLEFQKEPGAAKRP